MEDRGETHSAIYILASPVFLKHAETTKIEKLLRFAGPWLRHLENGSKIDNTTMSATPGQPLRIKGFLSDG
jgi:hypothetical protein